MTTKLDGKSTRFLPFNLGHNLREGQPAQPGRPQDLATSGSGSGRRSLARHPPSLHPRRPSGEGIRSRRGGRPRRSSSPATTSGTRCSSSRPMPARTAPGRSYLDPALGRLGQVATQSPGPPTVSRRSTPRTTGKVFDKVVVITDRVILDRQLQDTIYQFEHATRGGRQDRRGLARSSPQALAGEQARIIITTLQKFPFVLDKVGDLPAAQLRRRHRRGALVPDRRGRQGPAAGSRRGAEEAGADGGRGRGRRPALDGDRPGRGGLARSVARAAVGSRISRTSPSRRPPRAERWRCSGGLNPDARSTSPSTSTRCARPSRRASSWTCSPTTRPTRPSGRSRRRPRTTPSTTPSKARRAIARFVSLHPHHLAQKAEIIVEHFRQHTAKEIGGAGEGDGRDVVPPARGPLQAEHRQVHQGEGLLGHQDAWSRSRARSTTAPASRSPRRT